MARLKSDFVANVSHDLKTPLSLIRMFAETLEMNRVPDEATRREYCGVITRESERLSRLIDNALDFSRIESGRQRYELEPGALEDNLRFEGYETVSARAPGRGRHARSPTSCGSGRRSSGTPSARGTS